MKLDYRGKQYPWTQTASKDCDEFVGSVKTLYHSEELDNFTSHYTDLTPFLKWGGVASVCISLGFAVHGAALIRYPLYCHVSNIMSAWKAFRDHTRPPPVESSVTRSVTVV